MKTFTQTSAVAAARTLPEQSQIITKAGDGDAPPAIENAASLQPPIITNIALDIQNIYGWILLHPATTALALMGVMLALFFIASQYAK